MLSKRAYGEAARKTPQVVPFVEGMKAVYREERTGPGKIYHAGQSFSEPAGNEHLRSENVSETASMLVLFLAEDGGQLTISDIK